MALRGFSKTFLVFPISFNSSFIVKDTSKSFRSISLTLKILSFFIQKSEAPLLEIKFNAPISFIGFWNLKSTISKNLQAKRPKLGKSKSILSL